jgi:hypothetical protein
MGVAEPIVLKTIQPLFENIFVWPKGGSGHFFGSGRGRFVQKNAKSKDRYVLKICIYLILDG